MKLQQILFKKLCQQLMICHKDSIKNDKYNIEQRILQGILNTTVNQIFCI